MRPQSDECQKARISDEVSMLSMVHKGSFTKPRECQGLPSYNTKVALIDFYLARQLQRGEWFGGGE